MTFLLFLGALACFTANPLVGLILIILARVNSDVAGTPTATETAPPPAPPPLTPEALQARRQVLEASDLEQITREVEEGADPSDFPPPDLDISDAPRPWEECESARPLRFMGKPVPHESTVGPNHHGPVWTADNRCVWRGPKRRPKTPDFTDAEIEHLYALGWPLLTAPGTPWPTRRQRQARWL